MKPKFLNTAICILLIFSLSCFIIQPVVYGHFVNPTHVPMQRAIGRALNPLPTININRTKIMQ